MGKRSRADATTDDAIELMAVGPDGELIPIEAVPPSVGDLITEVADAVLPAARATGPAKFGVEFGIRVRRDGTVALTDATSRATFRVFLEWNGREG